MDLLLSGTGPATGFPVPGCPCATCRSASPAAASRPAELRLGRYRLDLDGTLHEPAENPADGTDGTDSTDSTERAHRLRGGERLRLPGLDVRALGTAGEPVSLLVQVDGAKPLLWAPQGGRPSAGTLAELAGVTLALVILGPAPERDPQAPGATAAVQCAQALAQLRATSAVTVETRCLMVGLGHRRGPADRLTIGLQHWGAEVPADGTRLRDLDRDPDPDLDLDPGLGVPVTGGRTLVLGGSASGKSGLAEDLLAAEPAVLYTATGPVVDLRSDPDEEWAQRVRRHRERRPAWWRTEETHRVADLLATPGPPILLDSVGTWLAGVLDRAGAWDGRDGWRRQVGVETDVLVRAWRACRRPLVAVSDEVGLGVVPATASGRLFRDELGRLNRRLADESEQVLVVVAGRLLTGVGATGPGPQ